MHYNAEFTAAGLDELASLDSTIQDRVFKKIRWLAEHLDDITPQALSADLSGLFKLRVGDYRVIYSYDVAAQLVTVHKVGHRRDIYDT